MDTASARHEPQMDFTKRHSLGQRAFLLFLSRRIKFVLFLFALVAGAWYVERWLPPDYLLWGIYVTQALLVIAITYFVIIFVRTYLEYRYYTYLFTDDAFIMTFGYVVRNEVATLYHHIQSVNIERSMLDRMIGVSKLVIVMIGSERESRRNQTVLPAIGKKKARLVQGELLRRARRHMERYGADG